MLVSVVSRGENCFTKLARIARNTREVYALYMVLNVLFSVVDLATYVAPILSRTQTASLHKSLYVWQQPFPPCKLKKQSSLYCDKLDMWLH